jgi:transcriptional regulator with XRE-family HTH domain
VSDVVGGRQGASGFDPARLRTAREAAQLSRGALAEAASVHPSSVSEWESGRQVPRVETVAALAKALQIQPDDLLEPVEGAPLTLGRLRIAAGKSQQQIAEAAGMLRTTYSAVERGETGALSYAEHQALARAFGVTDDQLRGAQDASRNAYLGRHPRPNGRRRTRSDS